MNLFAGCTAAKLEEVLTEREERARRREELLKRFGPPLLCLTLNIPGAYKEFPLARRCFFEGMKVLKQNLRAEGLIIRHEEFSEGTAGYRNFIIASGAGGLSLKAMALRIEETHPLGRLFDIDVLEREGKIPRTALGAGERKCLICGENAFACGRSRAHSAEELTGAVINIMENFLREKLGNIILNAAMRALMGEVAVSPKPGLVDRANNGAHRDMDFFTFIDSTAAILPFFREYALAGFESAPVPAEPPSTQIPAASGSTEASHGPGKSLSPVELFNSLRVQGKIAEQEMRKASGGVNTHRGVIFSLGLLSAAFGRLYRYEENPSQNSLTGLCRSMTVFLAEDFSRAGGNDPAHPRGAAGSGTPPSHGEALFIRHGISGIRGEVSRGFPTVLNTAYPALCRLLDEGYSLNDAGTAAFLRLLAAAEDTNIVHRSDPEELRRIQNETAAFLAADPSMEKIREKAAELDREFIRLNISPGGCADLLAVTLFLYRLFNRHE